MEIIGARDVLNQMDFLEGIVHALRTLPLYILLDMNSLLSIVTKLTKIDCF